MIPQFKKILSRLLGGALPSSLPDIGTSHLEYDSVEEWMASENVPDGFVYEPDSGLRNKYIRQYGELRRHLYAMHALTLSPDDQAKIDKGCHPSQSHKYASDATSYCVALQRHLESLGLDVSDVKVGFYHMDRIVLSVDTADPLGPERQRSLPWLFEGFEIKYS